MQTFCHMHGLCISEMSVCISLKFLLSRFFHTSYISENNMIQVLWLTQCKKNMGEGIAAPFFKLLGQFCLAVGWYKNCPKGVCIHVISYIYFAVFLFPGNIFFSSQLSNSMNFWEIKTSYVYIEKPCHFPSIKSKIYLFQVQQSVNLNKVNLKWDIAS